MPAITFYNPIPSSYNVKRQRTQFVETMGATTLPAGKVWVHNKGAYTVAEMKSRGVTHLSKYDNVSLPDAERIALQDAGETYDAVPRPEAFLGLSYDPSRPYGATDPLGYWYSPQYWPDGPLSTSQAEAKANSMSLDHALWVGETEEGTSWIAPGHPMWRTIWTRFRQRMASKWTALGKPFFIAANYFHNFGNGMYGWANLSGVSRNEVKEKFARPLSAWEANDYTPGGTRAATNLICEGIYLGAPDLVRRIVSQNIFNHLVNKKMGYYSASFLFAVHEWRPNNFQSIEYAEEYFPGSGNWGMFLTADKIRIDPNVHMSIACWSLEFGDMFLEWAGEGKPSTDNVGYGWVANHLWYPNGNTTPNGQQPQPPNVGGGGYIASGFPYYQLSGGKSFPNNWSAFGVRMYSETFGKVTGVGSTAGFCEYRLGVGGVWGAWVTPQSTTENEIIDSFYDQRAFVRYRRLAGKIALGYFNELAPNTKQSIEIKHPTTPGVVYTGEVCGSATFVVLITE